MPAVACFLEALPGEDVLFVQGIALAKCLCQCGEQPSVLIIAVDAGGELLHRILDAQDGGIFSGLGVEGYRCPPRPQWRNKFLRNMRLRLPPVPNALTEMAMPAKEP